MEAQAGNALTPLREPVERFTTAFSELPIAHAQYAYSSVLLEGNVMEFVER
jgi:hypothetical protein